MSGEEVLVFRGSVRYDFRSQLLKCSSAEDCFAIRVDSDYVSAGQGASIIVVAEEESGAIGAILGTELWSSDRHYIIRNPWAVREPVCVA